MRYLSTYSTEANCLSLMNLWSDCREWVTTDAFRQEKLGFLLERYNDLTFFVLEQGHTDGYQANLIEDIEERYSSAIAGSAVGRIPKIMDNTFRKYVLINSSLWSLNPL